MFVLATEKVATAKRSQSRGVYARLMELWAGHGLRQYIKAANAKNTWAISKQARKTLLV
jgi:hypothetical protein